MDMRGLSTFISDVRKAQTKEEEDERINAELSKIRTKFKTNPKMKGYDRKKYICKILYIYMLGYDIDFGHMEAIELVTSSKYSEKHTGYLAVSLLLDETNEILTLVIQSIKKDLFSMDENIVCLALTTIANVAGREFAEVLSTDVLKILTSGETKSLVRKKAALTLLRLYRKYPEILPPDTSATKIISLLSSRDTGVITSTLSLLLGLVSVNPASYEKCVGSVVDLLTKFVLNKVYGSDYVYYGIPAPWTQVKLLRLLQYYPEPTDKNMSGSIHNIIARIIESTGRIKELDKGKTVSRTNAAHSVLFEALNVAIHYDSHVEILANASGILSKYLTEKDTNLRYLALDTMSRLAYSTRQEVITSIRKNQETIFYALKDKDISIRRRALDLLYSMCDKQNAKAIVGELEVYLPVSDFAIREELVLKVAILAEKFAQDFNWYVDVILGLVNQAGDFVSDDIWFRVVQIVTNSKDKELQKYTASTVLKAVSSPAAHEAAIKLAGYILGEYGNLIQTQGSQMYQVLIAKFDTCKNSTKAILFDTFIKFYNHFEDVREKVEQVFESNRNNIDPELQQRAVEYYNLIQSGDFKMISFLVKQMPAFAERESSVLKKIMERQYESQFRKREGDKKDGKDDEEEEEEEPVVVKKEAQQVGDLLDLLGGGSSNPGSSVGLSIDDLLSGINSAPQTQPNIGVVDPFAMFDTQVTSKPVVKKEPVKEDLFSMGGGNDTLAKMTSEIAKQKQTNRENLGMGIEDIMSKTKEMELEKEQRQIQQDSQKSFQNLCVSSQGVIIEDGTVVISVKSEYHGPKGRMALFFGNKGGSVVSQTRIDIKQIPEVKIEYSVLAPMITPGNQIQQYVTVTCLEPFQKEVSASFYFEYEKKSYRFNFRLPLVPHKFVEPFTMNSTLFFQQWNNIQKGTSLEKMEIVRSNQPLPDVGQTKLLLANGFSLAILDGVDSNPNNLVAAGKFFTEKSVYPVYVRLECNPKSQAYRLTVRSTDSTITSSIWSALASQLVIE